MTDQQSWPNHIEMDNINFLRYDLPDTFDYSKRKVINNSKVLELPTFPAPSHKMDQLRVRNFVANPPLPRQIPTIDEVEEERRKKYGMRVDIDPSAFAAQLGKMVLKLPTVNNDGVPIKDQTGRMVYRYYTFKEMMDVPFLRQFRLSQLRSGAPSAISSIFEEEAIGDSDEEEDIIQDNISLVSVESLSGDDLLDILPGTHTSPPPHTSIRQYSRETTPVQIDQPVLTDPESEEDKKEEKKEELTISEAPEVVAAQKQRLTMVRRKFTLAHNKNPDLAGLRNKMSRKEKIMVNYEQLNGTSNIGQQIMDYFRSKTYHRTSAQGTPAHIYLKFANYVLYTYGPKLFDFTTAVKAFNNQWEHNKLEVIDDPIAEMMVLYMSKQEVDKIDNYLIKDTYIGISAKELEHPTTVRKASLWSSIWELRAHRKAPFNLVRQTFLLFIRDTYHDKEVNLTTALQEYRKTGSFEVWMKKTQLDV